VWTRGAGPGAHTFELVRSLAPPSGRIAHRAHILGPAGLPTGTTANGTTTPSAQQLVGSLAPPAGTQAVAIAATASADPDPPVRPGGRVLATADNSSGFAVIGGSRLGGAYLLKTVNLSAGPVQV
jgi:hypothetical protein